jgi:chromosome partitioning protein
MDTVVALKIAVASQKGGPGKTTTTVNLGGALALNGLRVLVVDLDPQAQAGVSYGIVPQPARSIGFALYARFNDMSLPLGPMIYSRDELLTDFDDVGRLDLLGGVQSTTVDAERKIASGDFEATLMLQQVLEEIDDKYDVILLDTPPSVSALAAAALAAANFVIAVSEPLYATVPGVAVVKGLTEATPERTKNQAHPRFIGTVINKANPPSKRTSEDERVEERLRDLDLMAFEAQIRRNTLISSAFDEGRPVVILHPNQTPSRQYLELATEIVDRIKQAGT